MLSGDLSTMSLADVLQWADSTRVPGTLTIARPSGAIWMRIAERHVVGCVQPPSRGVVPRHLAERIDPRELALDEQALAVEMLYDQFLDSDDAFRFEPGDGTREPGVTLEISLQEVVMTGMQYVDEWVEVRTLYPSSGARVRRLEGPHPQSLTEVQLGLLRLAAFEPSLGETRQCLGVSQPAALRNVDLLRRLGCVLVEGAPEVADLTEQLVHKTMVLVREKQFDEATHVFAALLSTEPGSRRIRELLRRVEREHVAELYTWVPARALVRKRPRVAVVESWLTRADREVLERVNNRWDVATLVLASTTREVETLKSLRKLQRMEAIELILPKESLRPEPAPTSEAGGDSKRP